VTENLWDEELEVLTIAEVHHLLDSRATSDYLVAGPSWDELEEYNGSSWPGYNGIVELFMDDELFKRLCECPCSFSATEHDVFDFIAASWGNESILDSSVSGWRGMRFDRNRFLHSVRTIQRATKHWLYNPDTGKVVKRLKLSFDAAITAW
jgi:hypothetical protein